MDHFECDAGGGVEVLQGAELEEALLARDELK